jgi:hypothetical protein
VNEHAAYLAVRVVLAFAFVSPFALAQAPELPPATVAAFERVGEAVRDRAATADDADAAFVRGLQATMDPAARAAGFARAFELDPRRMLFLASLADACMTRTLPVVPECAAIDPVSRWAARDGENAAPWVLLAARSRARGDLPGMRENLAHAGTRARFDSYRERGGPSVWRVIGASPAATLAEAPFAATALGASRSDIASAEAARICQRGGAGIDDAAALACRALARTMATRGDTWAARQAGLELARGWIVDRTEHQAIAAEAERVAAGEIACRATRVALLGRLADDAAVRARARGVEVAALDAAATEPEPVVCARRIERARAAALL